MTRTGDLDVAANRGARKYGARVHFYPSSRIIMPWNLEICAQAAVGDSAILYTLGPISIGPRATVSQFARICAGSHDIARLDRAPLTLPIEISAEAMQNIAPGHVVAGNPTKTFRRLDS